MKRYTQAEFEAFPVVDGWKQCPTGDYSAITQFPAWSSIGAWCRFGDGCRFGAGCSFGAVCRFGEGCSFGAGCSFGERCRFGAGCRFENDKALIGSTVYSGGGFGSEDRTTYGIPTKDELWIRCGCWFGTVADFRSRVIDTRGESDIGAEYAALADLFVMRWRRELKAVK